MPLDATQFKLYAYLVCCSGSKGYCWPTHKKIIQDTGIKKSSLQKANKALVKRKLIAVYKHRNPYHTSFVLCEIDNSEYLIPYGSRPDLTGLENGKLYTRKEVSQILSQTFGNGYSPNDNAGGPANVMHTLIPIALIASFVFLCVATFLLYRNNKKRG
jgi:hypothetical protein